MLSKASKAGSCPRPRGLPSLAHPPGPHPHFICLQTWSPCPGEKGTGGGLVGEGRRQSRGLWSTFFFERIEMIDCPALFSKLFQRGGQIVRCCLCLASLRVQVHVCVSIVTLHMCTCVSDDMHSCTHTCGSMPWISAILSLFVFTSVYLWGV